MGDNMFNLNKRVTTVKTLYIDSFKVDGKPTCGSWFGSKEHPKEICQFLFTKHFGQQYVCGYTDDHLDDYEGTHMLKPCDRCPLHKES